MIDKVYAVYFSPAGSTKAVTEHVAGRIADMLKVTREVIDFTLPVNRKEKYEFTANDLVVMGTPTYAGRIPNKILPFVQTLFEGNGAWAVSLVTFGNRSFDSSLTELVEEMSAKSFRVLAAGAFVCRHVFSDKIAAGRPDEADYRKMDLFADEAGRLAVEVAGEAGRRAVEVAGEAGQPSAAGHCPENLEADTWKPPVIRGGEPVAPYYIPKGEDGQPAKFLKAKPLTDPAKCTNCGICARVCPMGSISMDNCAEVPGICIKCQACVIKCPEGAKYFDDAAFLSHVRMLENNGSIIFLVGLTLPHCRLSIPSASLDRNLRQCFSVVTPTATNSGTVCFLLVGPRHRSIA